MLRSQKHTLRPHYPLQIPHTELDYHGLSVASESNQLTIIYLNESQRHFTPARRPAAKTTLQRVQRVEPNLYLHRRLRQRLPSSPPYRKCLGLSEPNARTICAEALPIKANDLSYLIREPRMIAIINLIRMHRTSIQPAVARVNPPRVRIVPALGDAKDPNAVELSFHIAVIAPLSDNPEGVAYRKRRFIEIDRDNFNSVLSAMKPALRFRVECKLSDDPDTRLAVDLAFRQIEDFEPAAVARQIPAVRDLLELRGNLAELRRLIYRNDKAQEMLQNILSPESLSWMASAISAPTNPPAESAVPQAGLPDSAPAVEISPETLLQSLVREIGAQSPFERDRTERLVWDFVHQVLRGEMVIARDADMMLNARIAALDHRLSLQINEVIHTCAFQSLEATWRGLYYLVREAETSSAHRILVLNASKKEILRDIQRAADYRDVDLHRKLNEPLETLGGQPFGCIVAAYEFSRGPEDVELMEVLGRIGSQIYAPVLAAPFLESFGSPGDWSAPFHSGAEYAKWNSLRSREYARFLVLVVPRMLLRLPYGRNTAQVEAFNFEEGVDGSDASRYLWGNAVWALAARISAAWSTYGWCAAIQSREGGGLVRDLPVHWFHTDEGDIRSHPTTAIVITERLEAQLFELGLCSLCQYSQSAEAVFPRVPTFKRPGRFLEPEANWNDRFGVQLPFVLACCRFALAIRMIVRDSGGLFNDPGQCEKTLNEWLAQYVLADENAAGASRAAFPLRDARIEVERPYHGARWVAGLYLRPHFQLDGLTTSLRIAIELPIDS
jgi:type VI secretion system protein ImpC